MYNWTNRMEKKYQNGLVLGKFLPPHLGHIYLIDTALENCETVHVICTHNPSQSISGDIRVNTLKEIYKNNKNIIIYSVDDSGLPQHDYECKTLDEFYSHWVPLVYDNVGKLDVVFTSEDYGDDFAKYLGVEHILVDKERVKYPVSGTKIRTNPFDNWKFIPEQIKPFFVKRIAIMGPESTGKSTLSKTLSNYFDTNFVVEYGRTIYENNGNKIYLDDFIPISKGRQSLEDWVIQGSNKVLFCDTEDITTYLFLKMFFPNESHKIEDWFLNEMSIKKKYDIYLLLKPDCKAVQDGTRIFLEERWDHYEEIKKELVRQGCNFVEVGGTEWKERFDSCIEIVKSNFNI